MSNQSNEKEGYMKKIKTVLFEVDKNTEKSKPTPVFWIVLSAIIIISAIFGFTNKNAQEIYVGNTKIGVINGTKVTADELKDMVIAKIKGSENTNIEIKDAISINKVRSPKIDLISLDYALYKISQVTNYVTEGSTIYVDGKSIVSLPSKTEAEEVLQEIKNLYSDSNPNIKEVSFVQNVELKPEFADEDKFSTKQIAIDLLTASTDQEKKYSIKEGDTFYQIAIDHGISLDDLFKANPNITEDTVLKIGQEINLVVPTPLVSVKTVEEVTYTEEIKRSTETTYNDSQYKTYRKVLNEGSDGEKQVSANLIKINGYEEIVQVISEEIIVEPVAQVVEVGTLNVPPKAAIGNFIYPVNARISSGYGNRSDGVHKGIDLATAAGTPIKASDGGTVIYSGWYGDYGNLVKIDHGNGFVTLYGHNSSNNVVVGQKVAQGEVIAYVGSTGYSTGNHVHFEIVKDGLPQNPINYLQ